MAENRTARVKNRAPAPIQITAEQLLREASERQENTSGPPRQRVSDFEELNEYRGRKRQEFEERIRRTRSDLREWTKYAMFESQQGEFARARSVFERALDVEPASVKLWLAYCDMELKARNISHARNLFDRAVTLLPRIDQVWYKYVFLEELLGNIAGARQVFERWMAWEPNEKAWSAYIKLEMRYNEFDRAAALWERLVACHPEPKNWTKWARYEEDRGKLDRGREIFQMALEFFGEEEEQLEKAQNLYGSFAKMETRHKEYDRARVIYKYALDRLPRSKSHQLYSSYTTFEKQFGNRSGIETTVLGKRRIQYEEELNHEPMNYDIWFDYSRLEEEHYRSLVIDGTSAKEIDAQANKVREIYERAVAQVPPSTEKRHWRRYIYLFINYALFEEIETKDYDRSRDVYKAAIKLMPNKRFTFAKVWLLYSQFELRRQDIGQARKILGMSIGMCPKEKLFKGYIEQELQLREFDNCRKLYGKYLEYDPTNSAAWIRFAELEKLLGDIDRARAIFELAVDQENIDMPELLWKAYIDFEYEEEEWERTRDLYERLLRKTSHVKVWVSYAQFEANAGRSIAESYLPDEEDEEAAKAPVDQASMDAAIAEGMTKARAVFKKGYADLKNRSLKEERVVLLEAWKALEASLDESQTNQFKEVEAMMPRVVKKRRKVDEDGSMEEYFDLIFADDEQQQNPASFKLLQLAHAWKAKQAAAAAAAQNQDAELAVTEAQPANGDEMEL